MQLSAFEGHLELVASPNRAVFEAADRDD